MTSKSIITFWFQELNSKQWWEKNPDLDAQIAERFLPTLLAAARGELFNWRTSAEGRLAEILVLDQFSRNIFRGKPESFAQDSLALILSQEAVLGGALSELPPQKQAFLLMPYMHSESSLIHEEAIKLFSRPGLDFNLDFEKKHKVIIDRFGRYPHRNEILGRISTPEEVEFLKQPGSSF